MRRSGPIWYRVKNVLRITTVLLLFVALYSYAMFQGGFISWFLVYTASVLVLLIILYALIPLGSFQMTREFGEKAVPAQSKVLVNVTIKRKWPFPFLYLYVEEKLDERLGKQISKGNDKRIFYPSFKKELTYSYEIPEVKRGEYTFHGAELETSDMFGLFYKRKTVEIEDTLLVYPHYHKIEKWSPYEKGELETQLSSLDFIEELTSVSGAREYEPGDKLTSIDWKVTARSNKLMTKEFEQYLSQNFLVILNKQIPGYSSPSLESFEAAVELATSIIVHASKEQLGIGLRTIGEKTIEYPIQSGSDHKRELIRHLAKIEGEKSTSLGSQMKEIEYNNGRQTTLVFLSTEVTDEVIERVRLYASRRVKVFFVLLDRDAATNKWDDKGIEEIRRYGVHAYVLSEGNIDLAVSSL